MKRDHRMLFVLAIAVALGGCAALVQWGGAEAGDYAALLPTSGDAGDTGGDTASASDRP
jgi:hypothetical protein